MKGALRILSVMTSFFWVGWMSGHLPGYELGSRTFGIVVSVWEDDGIFEELVMFSFLLPWVLLFGGFLGGRLDGVCGGLRYLLGARASSDHEKRAKAQSALFGAARALLWGSLALFLGVAIYGLRPDPSTGNLLWLDANLRLQIMQQWGYFTVFTFVLVLYPSAISMDLDAARQPAWLRAIDFSVLLGHTMALVAFPLAILMRWPPIRDAENSSVSFLIPSMDDVNLSFVAWCAAFVMVTATFLLLPSCGKFRGVQVGPGKLPLGIAVLASGVLCCAVIRAAGFEHLGRLRGTTTEVELQALGGRMLVPLLLVIVFLGIHHLSPNKVSAPSVPGG